MGRFAKAAAKLRGLGVFPETLALGGAPANYFTVKGFTSRHLAAAFAAGVFFCAGIMALVFVETGHWIGGLDDEKIVEAVTASGVDIKTLSAADLAARLSVPPEDGRVLVEALGDGNKALVDDLARWLRTMDRAIRREILQNLMLLSHATGNDEFRFRLAKAILDLDNASARALAEASDVLELLRKFAKIPPVSRQALIDADFPIRPMDDTRAHLWSVINSRDFPANDLVVPLSELALAHSSRLDAIRKYVGDGAPLPQCKRVACFPVACQAISSSPNPCESGSYLTVEPVCISYQGRKK